MNRRDTILLEFPAKYRYLNVLSTAIQSMLVDLDGVAEPADVIYQLQLAVQEVCNNIIEHAYRPESEQETGRIKVQLMIDPSDLRFVADLYDTGGTFNPNAVATPNLDEPQEEGYGLFLVHNLMDQVIYEPAEGNNHWRLVKHLGSTSD